MAKKLGSDELSKWAAEVHKPTHCRTCRDYPHLVPVIREYLQMARNCHPEGKTTSRNIRDFLITFLKPRGYELSYEALLRHMKYCETGVRRKENE